jgi:L-lactate dehydrogenase
MFVQAMNPDKPRIKPENLWQFGIALLTAASLSDDRARDVAEVLLEADLLGHNTHGFALLPKYLEALQNGGMSRTGEPETVADHGSSVLWDGNYLPGPWLMRKAIALAQERLVERPTMTVVIRRSHHIGCLQAYLKPVTDAGQMILLTCSDPASFTVAPFGGTTPCYSPNPIAVGIPTSDTPILIDISLSSTANAVCKRAADSGEKLPGQWLIDHAGNATNDPQVMFDKRGGALLPLGGTDLGYKGFALGLIVEAFTGALGGFGRADGETRWGASVFLQLIDPNRFGGLDRFKREMNHLADVCHNSPTIPGKPPVRLPGEGALRRREEQLKNGVMLHPEILPALKPWAQKFGLKLPLSS